LSFTPSVTAGKFIGNFRKKCEVNAKRNFNFRRFLVPEKAEATEDGGALNEKGQ
jgi:hypothetical protein